ncbi:MAG TPA: hypothetical protein VMV05_11330 [bacterium]|nr:hypothetical protein [bacterium]
MKNIFLFLVLSLLALMPLACSQQYYLAPLLSTPTPTVNATPTVTSTPLCVYPPTPTPGGGWSSGGTPMYLNPVSTPVPYTGNTTFVIHNLTQWQAQFGTTPPPSGMDFTTQMIVGGIFTHICNSQDSITSVCEGSTQVTVMVDMAPPPNCYISYPPVTQTLIVPQSSLPVIWLTP